MKNDITNVADIQQLVNTFYNRVKKDPLIGGIFLGIISDWSIHLEKMHRFWQTILLGEHTYNGSPFPPHARMPLTDAHFERWLQLWTSTVNELFEGENAEEAKWRGEKMATLFLSKITYYQNHGAHPLI